MKPIAFFAYGVACHAMFVGVFVYMAGFVGNLIVPKSIDSGTPGPLGAALAIDFGLLALFGVQHSVMARPAFKRLWMRIVPTPIERSTYVLISNLLVILLMWQWRPINIALWDASGTAIGAILLVLYAAGWLLVLLASLMINHFDLFGTRQVWMYLRGEKYRALPFKTPMLYRYVRHPLYVGWFTAFWVTPVMTVGHLLFAGTLSAYILGAVLLEERDLVAHLGHHYENYRRQVPRYVPRLRRTAPVTVEEAVQ